MSPGALTWDLQNNAFFYDQQQPPYHSGLQPGIILLCFNKRERINTFPSVSQQRYQASPMAAREEAT